MAGHAFIADLQTEVERMKTDICDALN